MVIAAVTDSQSETLMEISMVLTLAISSTIIIISCGIHKMEYYTAN